MRTIIFLLLLLMYAPVTKAQKAVYDLPQTWEYRNGISIMRTTLHEDGHLTSETIFGCFNCQGSGFCQVCKGTGAQYWYNIGLQPCGVCLGTGKCGGCSGKGYTVQNSTTQYGITVIYDERGNMYVCGGPGGSSSSGHSCNERSKVEVIEYIETYGVVANMNVYCPKCKKVTQRHIHVMKSR